MQVENNRQVVIWCESDDHLRLSVDKQGYWNEQIYWWNYSRGNWAGKFKDLTNKGKKLDLDDYFNTPEDLRVGYSVLKSAEYLPEEVQLLKEIEELKEKLGAISDETKRKELLKEIGQKQLKYSLLTDRFKRHKKIWQT